VKNHTKVGEEKPTNASKKTGLEIDEYMIGLSILFKIITPNQLVPRGK
jgi:hypothetical protein